ncbi:MAG TPA: PIG-L family deacetylase [bacterium]|nr:PIG-L family deacetylase [bacterium]
MTFQYYDLKRKIKSNDIALIFPGWEHKKETVVVFSPHDDDAILGAGYVLVATRANEGRVVVIIACDGRAGYSNPDQKNTIVEIRKQETIQAYKTLGLEEHDIIRFEIPDFSALSYIGWKLSSGIEGTFSKIIPLLRKIGATRLLIPNQYREHIDHLAVSWMGRFDGPQVGDDILADWGAPSKIKTFLEYSVWADFSPEDMILRDEIHSGIRANRAIKATKDVEEKIFESIRKFKSQEQVIASLVDTRKHRNSDKFCIEGYLDINPRPFLDYRNYWDFIEKIQ